MVIIEGPEGGTSAVDTPWSSMRDRLSRSVWAIESALRPHGGR